MPGANRDFVNKLDLLKSRLMQEQGQFQSRPFAGVVQNPVCSGSPAEIIHGVLAGGLLEVLVESA